MANLKGYRFFTDTETGGLNALKNQIFTMDYTIKDDSTGKIVSDAGFKIKVKKNKPISPYALYLTNLNPFSKEFQSVAISESEAIHKMKADVEKYTIANTVGGGIIRPKFTAYNARFDQSFVAIAMNRNGFKFTDVFNKSVTDPLKTARSMIKAKVFKTNAKGSAKLTEVAKALNFKVEGDAHTSKWDNLAQAFIYEETFKRQTGKSPYDTNAIIHNDLFEGEIYCVTTNSKSSGLKKRHILVLKNLDDDQKVIALDGDSIRAMMNDGGIKDTKKSKEYFDKTVREFNYATIIEENILNDQECDDIKAFALTHANDILQLQTEREETIRNRFLANGDTIFDSDVYDVDLIQGVEGLISTGEMNANEIRGALAEQGIDPASIAAIMTKAHEHNLSKGGDGIDGRDGWDEDAVNLALKDFGTIEGLLVENPVINDGVKGAANVLLLLREKFPERMAGLKYPELEKAIPYLDGDLEFQDDTLAITEEITVTEEESIAKVIEIAQFTNCKVCGRKLRGKVSVSTGIGPECREKATKKIKKPKAA